MDYKNKYLKYKNKYLKLKNQKGGNLQSEFLSKFPYEKEIINENTIKIKFMDIDYTVVFVENKILFNKGDKKVLEIEKHDDFIITYYFNDSLSLLREILKIFNFKYSQFFEKYFEDDDLFKYKDKDLYLLLNKEHPEYIQIKELFLSKREKFFTKITLEKYKRDQQFYVVYKGKEYEILEDNKDFILQNEFEKLIKFEIGSCISFMLIKEYDDCKDLVDLILNIYNLSLSIYNKRICDECIEFYNSFVYLNKSHELYVFIKNVLIEDTYNSQLGISKDLLKKTLYSINFIWLRIQSFKEKCFPISAIADMLIDFSSIDKILELQDNKFFIKLINFSKNNPKALVNFWFDATQVKTETIINFRIIFDTFNRHLGTNLCIRDIWSMRIINDMNTKYPDILPKCTGYSLILRVDLYKCMICVEELVRHTYSVFADLDMKPIGEDEVLSENKIRILNRIGLVLSKFSNIFENGFQILGSEIEYVRKGVIDTFNTMMIQRFMIILYKIKSDKYKFDDEYQNEIIFYAYQPMYKYLYYKCNFGILYLVTGKGEFSKNPSDEDILNNLSNVESYTSDYSKNYKINYLPFEIFNDDVDIKSNEIFKEKLTYNIFKELLNNHINLEKLINYIKKLRVYKIGIITDETILTYENPYELYLKMHIETQVQEDDLILFKDEDTIPPSSGYWPFKMCKKYLRK